MFDSLIFNCLKSKRWIKIGGSYQNLIIDYGKTCVKAESNVE